MKLRWPQVHPATLRASRCRIRPLWFSRAPIWREIRSLVVDTKFGGAKSFFGGEGLFVLQVQGTGCCSFHRSVRSIEKLFGPANNTSSIQAILSPGKAICSTAFERRRKAVSFRSFLSGEGMVAEFSGPGEILIQTRNLAAFAGLLKPFFPSQSGSERRFQFRKLTPRLRTGFN